MFDWAVMPDVEEVLGSGSEYPEGIWSDGTYIWASGGDDLKLYAYELETGERHSDRDIGLHADNGEPKGIWSDGATMWVLDSADSKLYAYDLRPGTGTTQRISEHLATRTMRSTASGQTAKRSGSPTATARRLTPTNSVQVKRSLT